jgi:DNA-binding transcriptional LysR family regulator
MFARLPQLNALRVFEAAARLESFKSAAAELHVTPTAVSHQIRALENRLGVRLFERGPRSVRLTAPGARLSRAVNAAFHEISSAISELSQDDSSLTITTTPSFAALWLVPRLADFEQTRPDVEIRLQTGDAVVPLAQQEQVDVAIRYGPTHPDEESVAVLAWERWGAYYNPASLKRRPGHGSILRRSVLIETRWKNPELPSIGWRDWLECHTPRIDRPRIRRFDSQLHALHAAMAGEGIVLCSDILAQTAVSQGWLKPYRPRDTVEGFAYRLIVAPGRERSPGVRAFRRWLAGGLKQS